MSLEYKINALKQVECIFTGVSGQIKLETAFYSIFSGVKMTHNNFSLTALCTYLLLRGVGVFDSLLGRGADACLLLFLFVCLLYIKILIRRDLISCL